MLKDRLHLSWQSGEETPLCRCPRNRPLCWNPNQHRGRKKERKKEGKEGGGSKEGGNGEKRKSREGRRAGRRTHLLASEAEAEPYLARYTLYRQTGRQTQDVSFCPGISFPHHPELLPEACHSTAHGETPASHSLLTPHLPTASLFLSEQVPSNGPLPHPYPRDSEQTESACTPRKEKMEGWTRGQAHCRARF